MKRESLLSVLYLKKTKNETKRKNDKKRVMVFLLTDVAVSAKCSAALLKYVEEMSTNF